MVNVINGDKMKKITILGLALFLTLTFLVGCSLSNTPTSQVENLFSKYQKVDKDIDDDIEEMLQEETLTNEQKERYRKILENQYKNLTYEIKDEIIDGETATVVVQIEVLDFKKAINSLNSQNDINFDILEYTNKKLDILENTKDKVVYTLNINVAKDNDGNWKILSLSNENIKKIQGMY